MGDVLFWLSDTNKKTISAFFLDKLNHVLREWLNHDVPVSILNLDDTFVLTELNELTDLQTGRYANFECVTSQSADLLFNKNELQQLLRLPLSETPSGKGLVQGVINDFLRDLYQALFSQDSFLTGRSDLPVESPYESKIFIECQIDTKIFVFIVDRHLLKKQSGITDSQSRKGGLEPIERALNGEGVEIQVMAGTVRMALSELNALSSGNVLLTDARVRAPLDVQLSGQSLAKGFIGQHQGHKALVIADDNVS